MIQVYGGGSGGSAAGGTVVVARSLRLTEQRENQALELALVGLVAALAGTAAAAGVSARLWARRQESRS